MRISKSVLCSRCYNSCKDYAQGWEEKHALLWVLSDYKKAPANDVNQTIVIALQQLAANRIVSRSSILEQHSANNNSIKRAFDAMEQLEGVETIRTLSSGRRVQAYRFAACAVDVDALNALPDDDVSTVDANIFQYHTLFISAVVCVFTRMLYLSPKMFIKARVPQIQKKKKNHVPKIF